MHLPRHVDVPPKCLESGAQCVCDTITWNARVALNNLSHDLFNPLLVSTITGEAASLQYGPTLWIM